VLILNIDFLFISDFWSADQLRPCEEEMRKRVEEIRRKIAELEKDAEELRFLKSACEDMKKIRRKIIQTKYD